MPDKQFNDIQGILLVDKPSEWTSHDVVNCIKHRFHVKKIGHCGTLDPMATGLLIVLMGKATKLQDALMATSKVYEGALRLGIETDSEDSTGNVIAERDACAVTEDMLRAAMSSFVGENQQIPPMVSAIQKNGQRLYDLARKGIVVEREPRNVTIHSFELLSCNLPEATYRVHCSKGTYIRTLCADVGKKLGCGAIMTALRRVKCGEHNVAEAFGIEAIKSWTLEELTSHVVWPLQ